MRLEHIPLIIGVIVALIGLGFIADASMAAASPVTPERRRRARAEPSRAGEAVVGIGTLCMAAALFGRDTWRYGTVAVLAGSALLLIGVILNRAFLKEALLFRGPARRSEEGVATRARPGTGGRDRGAAETPAPAAPPRGGGPGKAPAGGQVRHPTPPVASRAYKPAEPADATPTPVAGQSRFESTASSPPATSRPGPSPKPEAPGAKAPDVPTGPKERRKTPRGKR